MRIYMCIYICIYICICINTSYIYILESSAAPWAALIQTLHLVHVHGADQPPNTHITLCHRLSHRQLFGAGRP